MGSNATWRCVPGRPAAGPNHAVKGHGLNLGIRHLDRAWSLVGSAATPSGVDGFMGFGFRWCRFAQPPATGCYPSGMEGGGGRGRPRSRRWGPGVAPGWPRAAPLGRRGSSARRGTFRIHLGTFRMNARSLKMNPRSFAIDLRGQNIDLGGSNIDLGGQNIDLGGSNVDLEGSIIDLEGLRNEIEAQKINFEAWR